VEEEESIFKAIEEKKRKTKNMIRRRDSYWPNVARIQKQWPTSSSIRNIDWMGGPIDRYEHQHQQHKDIKHTYSCPIGEKEKELLQEKRERERESVCVFIKGYGPVRLHKYALNSLRSDDYDDPAAAAASQLTQMGST
jgi:hypothetical protein